MSTIGAVSSSSSINSGASIGFQLSTQWQGLRSV
jgi:hypothetical protein